MDIVTYALSKKYTDNSIAGGGAVKGKNCIVSSIDPITGGHRVTFQWTLDNGTVQTDYVDVMDGQIGPQGIQGPQGVQGPRGLQGIQGIQGVAGTKGDKGDKGDTGNTGAKGADGAAASISIGTVTSGASPSVENAGTSQNAVLDFTLPKGDKGDKGDKGEDGADGKSFEIKAQFPTEAALRAAHPTGNAGDAYFVGADQNPDLYVWLTDDNDWFNSGKIAGVKGDKGDPGDQGFSPVASVSKTDSTITISIRDKVGQTTATISDGQKGTDGKSAYEVAVDNGFVGTEAEWLQSLIGRQGPQGIQGDPGAQGLQGPQGNPGTTNYNDLINKPTLGTAAAKDSTDRVSPNNRGLVESQSVYSAITTALASIYTPAGDLTCAELTSDLLIADNVGKVYELSDSGTTSDLFLQGADQPLVVGDQIGIINAGQGRILFNYMANRIDLSAFQKRDLPQAVEGAATVEGALSALSANKVDKVSGKGLSTNDYTNADKAIVDGVTSALAGKANTADLAAVATSGDYKDLTNKPSIPSKTSDLTNDSNFTTTSDVNTALANYTTTTDLTTLLAAKQNTLTFDNTPTENSNNPVKSGGVYAANKQLTDNKADKVTSATAGDIAILDASGNLVDSGVSTRGIGKYAAAFLDSAGWYKIYEGANFGEGDALRINLSSLFANTANCSHVIDIAYGFYSVNISETCRDETPIFSKIRVCYSRDPSQPKNVIFVYYTPNIGNHVCANILSTQYNNNNEVFDFVAVDESQYTTYTEFNLGTSGLYENGVKVVTNEIVPSNVSASNKLVIENYLLTDESENDPATILINNINSFNNGTYNIAIKTAMWTYGITLFKAASDYWSAIIQSYGNDADRGLKRVLCDHGTVIRQNFITAAHNAGAHNSIYRGKYLGSSVTAEQYAQISAGTFEDLFIGDYWTISNVNYRIAAFDYWLNTGSPKCTTHHAVLVPDSVLYNASMNSSNTISGGYVGSLMYQSNLASAKNTINSAFGSTHILEHSDLFTNSANESGTTGSTWVNSTVDIMNESMVIGYGLWSTSGFDLGLDYLQLPLFALSREHIATDATWWLRSTYLRSIDDPSRLGFVYVTLDSSPARGAFPTVKHGVRPAFAIKG